MIPSDLAIILLASGRSKRFGPQNKLMAMFDGSPLCSYAARLFASQRTPLHCAIVPQDAPELSKLIANKGWSIITNPSPDLGQGNSLSLAIAHLQKTEASAALILLADMPFLSEDWLQEFIANTPDEHAAMSVNDTILQPPALFPRRAFAELAKISGDRGARKVFDKLPNTMTHALPPAMARDIDTQDALKSAEESLPYASSTH